MVSMRLMCLSLHPIRSAAIAAVIPIDFRADRSATPTAALSIILKLPTKIDHLPCVSYRLVFIKIKRWGAKTKEVTDFFKAIPDVGASELYINGHCLHGLFNCAYFVKTKKR